MRGTRGISAGRFRAVRRGASVAPSISITLSSAARAVVQGGSTTITATLTRVGGYTGTVVLSVTGLPTGVTGSWSDASLTGSESAAVLTLTAAVDASLVTADSFTITASGSGVSAATQGATVTVTEASAFAVNLPSGLTLVYDETPDALGDLNGAHPSGWGYSSSTYGEILKIDDGTAPFGAKSLEITYPEGHIYGGGGNYGGPEGQSWVKLYFKQLVYVSSGYYCHENNEKYFYPFVVAPGEAWTGSVLTWNILDGAVDDPDFGFTLDTQTGMSNSSFFQSASSPHKMVKGAWNEVEVFMQMNTPGDTTDGILRVWVNGGLAMDVTTVRYGKYATQSAFYGMRFTGTRGGGDSAFPVPVGGQFRRYNRIAVYASTSF